MDVWVSGLNQLPAKEPTGQPVRWFKSSRVRHVSVAQLAERRVVAAEVVESYSIRHPIRVGGVHGWRAGLKIRERWFDSNPAHHAYASEVHSV